MTWGKSMELWQYFQKQEADQFLLGKHLKVNSYGIIYQRLLNTYYIIYKRMTHRFCQGRLTLC